MARNKTQINIHYPNRSEFYMNLFTFDNKRIQEYGIDLSRHVGDGFIVRRFQNFVLKNIKESLYSLKFTGEDAMLPKTKKKLARIVGKVNQDAQGWFPKNFPLIQNI